MAVMETFCSTSLHIGSACSTATVGRGFLVTMIYILSWLRWSAMRYNDVAKTDDMLLRDGIGLRLTRGEWWILERLYLMVVEDLEGPCHRSKGRLVHTRAQQ